MSTLITALKAATKIPGELKKLGKAEMAETVLKVSQGAYDQMGENLALKEELGNLKRDLREKEDDLKKLKDIISSKGNLRFENDCYWDEQGIPICSACLEKPTDPALVRMHTDGRSDGFVKCPICKNIAWSKGEVQYTVSPEPNFDPYDVI